MTAKLYQARLNGALIAPDTIGSGPLAPDSVGAAELANNAVGTAEIADSQVTTAKLAADAVSQIGSSAWSGSTTSVGSWAYALSLPGLTYTGGQVRVDWQLLGNNATASLGYIGYRVDGGTTFQMGLHQFTAGLYAQIAGFVLLGALSAAVHTIDIYWQVTGGQLFANTGSLVAVTEYKK